LADFGIGRSWKPVQKVSGHGDVFFRHCSPADYISLKYKQNVQCVDVCTCTAESTVNSLWYFRGQNWLSIQLKGRNWHQLNLWPLWLQYLGLYFYFHITYCMYG